MMKEWKLLKKDGFNYIKIDSWFEDTLYKEMNSTFPRLDKVMKMKSSKRPKFSNNNRIDLDIQFLKENDHILSEEWSQFIKETTTLSFFKELCNLLEIESESFKTISHRGSLEQSDIEVDFQICYNMKNKNKTQCFLREPHVDSDDKLIVILLYYPELNSVYKIKDMGNLYLYDSSYRKIDEIEYEHNRGIVFRNSPNAIHAPFALLNHEDENRRFINIVFIRSQRKEM